MTDDSKSSNKPWYFNISAPFPAGASAFFDDDDEELLTSALDAIELDLDDFAVPVSAPKKKHPLAKKIELPDGTHAMECVKCHNRIRWAEPNRDDGAFKCSECKMDW